MKNLVNTKASSSASGSTPSLRLGSLSLTDRSIISELRLKGSYSDVAQLCLSLDAYDTSGAGLSIESIEKLTNNPKVSSIQPSSGSMAVHSSFLEEDTAYFVISCDTELLAQTVAKKLSGIAPSLTVSVLSYQPSKNWLLYSEYEKEDAISAAYYEDINFSELNSDFNKEPSISSGSVTPSSLQLAPALARWLV